MNVKRLVYGSVFVSIIACSATEPPLPANREAVDDEISIEEIMVTAQHGESERSQADPALARATGKTEVDSAGVPSVRMYAKRAIEPSAEPQFWLPTVVDRENYDSFDDNPVRLVAEDPLSTFSIDVDTASYSNVRRLLNQGVLPRQDAVRTEEMINYFSYAYPLPRDGDAPFRVYTEVGPSPWHADRHLLHVGIKGVELERDELPAANLVFLIDVSGSMQSSDKIDLLKASLKLLTRELDVDDRISIAVYAGASGRVLEPTPGDQRGRIHAAIDQLTTGGSTNGEAGIRLAYAMAAQAYIADGINRVILATDGDFNVGTTDQSALKDLVEDKCRSGVVLTVLGFGGGNYNDALMQELAQVGDGNAAYIDTLSEARKVLIDQMAGTLTSIARDVKIQVEFNPELVSEYRLIGYESRVLAREDFNNDRVDAGDIGAGHTVTAIYELAFSGSTGRLVDDLRYGRETVVPATNARELAFVKLRYKLPAEQNSRLIQRAVRRDAVRAALQDTSEDYRFSAAVAAFGQVLRGGEYTGEYDLDILAELANGARGEDRHGYRGEFAMLVRTANVLTTAAPDHSKVAGVVQTRGDSR